MIYLNAEVVSGLGEDTFWTWFKREFPTSSFDEPKNLTDKDIVLRYSTLGPLDVFPAKTVALLWELYPEMKEKLVSNEWDAKLESVYRCAKFSTYRTVASHLTVAPYERYGTVDVIPIGVDTDLFRPIPEKDALRDKYNIPRNKRVGIWCGTLHPMKGYTKLLEFAKSNHDIHWIIVWKQKSEAGHLDGATNLTLVAQDVLVELINAADFYLCSGLLSPFYMIEWEAMACNLPLVILGDAKKDFAPSENPRDDIFALGWDRKSVKKKWENYLMRRGIEW
jgi:glycosyltransferase involved in cell wall biosynthesis